MFNISNHLIWLCLPIPPLQVKNLKKGLEPSISNWYPKPDSNRHASRREILSLLCLPFHHSGITKLVRIVGLEPTSLAALVFETNVYTIPPYPLITFGTRSRTRTDTPLSGRFWISCVLPFHHSGTSFYWYGWWDSNPQAFRHSFLDCCVYHSATSTLLGIWGRTRTDTPFSGRF